MDWKAVTTHARRFEDNIAQKWPEYLEEMKGACDIELRALCGAADNNPKASLMDQIRMCLIS